MAFEIVGKYNTAKVFAPWIEDTASAQIKILCDQEAFKDAKIRIMPDCHAGAGCVIGFTGSFGNKIIPNIVGVDLGCGMHTSKFKADDIDFEKLDKFILENIPFGFNGRKTIHALVEKDSWFIERVQNVCDIINESDVNKQLLKCSSLGSGNHYFELDTDGTYIYLVIHSGSRNFGHRVATYFQKKAIETCEADVPKDLKYLTGDLAQQYLYCTEVATEYAQKSREAMAHDIIDHMGWDIIDTFTTIHNYIDNGMIRKGAISAKKGERVLIPLNMRDGAIIGIGKGNEDYNCSAAHGAGRIMSRSQAKRELSMDAFIESMKGIYTSRVMESTLDEAPATYKDAQMIIDALGDTIEIEALIKPIYNFKA